MSTNYEDIIPQKILFSIREVEEMGAIKTDMLKKLITQGQIEIVKIGTKVHISRPELIRFLNDNTI
ncbi:FAD-binding protein [Malaciobacter marinus]|uniref:DNA-binding protein n=1 Tax=Malaciobacter marinus TaxID=505249 RepID=UPI000C08C54A|nr:DNA-binding protein [Malaciobacter marinus]PHO11359.1 FAD-binding protein [Malaciobacter marinus]